MLSIPSVRHTVEGIIAGIERDYRVTQGLILTEADLKCLIYSTLRDRIRSPQCWQHHPPFSHEFHDSLLSWKMKTYDDGIFATPIHTELAWYDNNEQLTIRPDITILLNPEELSILHGFGFKNKLPAKQYAFRGKAVLLELKFVRYKTGISRGTLKRFIEDDFNKIGLLNERLREITGTNDSIFCYFVIFNKTNVACEEFMDFARRRGEDSWYKIIYATGLVTFP